MIISRKARRIRERALYALLSESTVEAAARSARMKEEDLRAMLVYPLFRARYHQSRQAFNLIRTAMGYPEGPDLAELIQRCSNTAGIRNKPSRSAWNGGNSCVPAGSFSTGSKTTQ
jgi:hypothetical protein